MWLEQLKKTLVILGGPLTLAVSVNAGAAGGGGALAKLSAEDLAGGAFNSPDTIITEGDAGTILDFTSLTASDGKFASGVYSAGPQAIDITEPYAHQSPRLPSSLLPRPTNTCPAVNTIAG